jgi:hypothetical protein
MATAFYSDDYEDREGEAWKPVVGFEGYFQVSNMGTVRSLSRVSDYPSVHGPIQRKLRGRILRHRWGGPANSRYPFVSLNVDGVDTQVKVHRLVCEAFHGPAPEGCTDVAHNDGNRDNPRADNLRWATRKENMADCIVHGTLRHGETHQSARLTDAQVVEIRRSKEPAAVIAPRFGIIPNYVYDIRGNKRRRSAGS